MVAVESGCGQLLLLLLRGKGKRRRRSPPATSFFVLPHFSFEISPFCREVIERRPEDHKIECLKQIRALFPADYHPLHAGFGNKSSVSERESIQPRLEGCISPYAGNEHA